VSVKKLPYVPRGYTDIIRIYGIPDRNGDGVLDTSWTKAYLKVFDLPFPLKLSWNPDKLVNRFQANIEVGRVIQDALEEIGNFRGGAYLNQEGYNYWGGCFNFRASKGSGRLSTHSWGIAVDLNPHLGPWSKDKETQKQPQFIVDAFKNRGFEWGGDWPERYNFPYYDGMHFQAATNY